MHRLEIQEVSNKNTALPYIKMWVALVLSNNTSIIQIGIDSKNTKWEKTYIKFIPDPNYLTGDLVSDSAHVEEAKIILKELEKGFAFKNALEEEWWNKNGQVFLDRLTSYANYKSKTYKIIKS